MSREFENNNEEENRKHTARKIGEEPAQDAPEMESGADRGDAGPESMTEPENAPAADVSAADAAPETEDILAAGAEPEAGEAPPEQDYETDGEPSEQRTFGKNKLEEPLRVERERTPWSTKKKVILIVVIAAVAAAAVLAYLFLGQSRGLAGDDLRQIMDDGTFYEGVSMEGVDLSGKTIDEARPEVEARVDEALKDVSIDYKVNEDTYTLTSAELGAKADVDEALKTAMLYGREGSFAQRSQAIETAKTQGAEIEMPFTYDEATILASIQANDEKINIPAQNASIVVNKQRDEDKLFTDVEIDYKDSVTGLEVNDQELAAAVYAQLEQNNFEPVTANAQVTQPEITGEQIKDKYDVIGDFETKYTSSAFGRRYNIWKMADIINGIEILPGETWSINDEAGPRTYSRGWKGAPGISDGEYKEEAGGGICQTNSTLYGAVIRAEVEVVDRTHHSWPLDYVPGGLDATISTGSPDFKIKNNYDIPIYIISKCDGQAGTIRMQIYGPKFEDGLRREFTSELIGTFGGGKVNYIDDPSLPQGTEQTIIQEHIGKKYQTYKHYYDADGNEVKVEKFSVETYDNKPAKVRRGTGAPETPPETPQTPETPTVPTQTPETPVEPAPVPETPTEPTQAPETPTVPAEDGGGA
ncbi:VanW family protein [Christensenella intestinihominis]|uniref:VanW family protein n=1 Tax=Christensenella intestinihominis TaxID=1851429 RepID=UPI000832401D|nr:VanW family protein [Christensenella intestinihominis]